MILKVYYNNSLCFRGYRVVAPNVESQINRKNDCKARIIQDYSKCTLIQHHYNGNLLLRKPYP